ncbi:helix-turn-helix transcriptional regulator [Sphingobacterium sp. E70]
MLRKLEDRELIQSEWKIAENEKRRRYYTITKKE